MSLAYGERPTYGMLFMCVFSASISLSFVTPPPPAVSPNNKVNSKTSAVEGKFSDLHCSQKNKYQAK